MESDDNEVAHSDIEEAYYYCYNCECDFSFYGHTDTCIHCKKGFIALLTSSNVSAENSYADEFISSNMNETLGPNVDVENNHLNFAGGDFNLTNMVQFVDGIRNSISAPSSFSLDPLDIHNFFTVSQNFVNNIVFTFESPDVELPASELSLSRLETVTIDASNIEKYKNTNCVICRDAYNEGDRICILTCKHDFHVSCVHTWFKSRDSCPVCRSKI